MRFKANHRHCTTHCKPETKKTGDSSNICVCLYRPLKLLTDDQVASQQSQIKTYYITVTITQKCAINYFRLTKKH